MQLYKFGCTIPTQNININLHSKPPVSRLLRHTWAIAVMQFFDFRQKHSAQQVIITLVDKITKILDSGDIVIGGFFI